MAWLNNNMVCRRGRPGVVLRLATVAGLLLFAVPALRLIAATPPGLAAAIGAQRSLLEATPRNVTLLNDLANLLSLASEIGEAEEIYRQALELDPERASTRYNLALLFQSTGRRRLAKREFEAVLKIRPDHAWSHYQLGRLFTEAGSRRKAISHYSQAFLLEPRLTLPDVNPHIVENELAIPALLMAHSSNSAAALAPRMYQHPERVRELLLPEGSVGAATSPEGTESTSPVGGRGARTGAAGAGVGTGQMSPSHVFAASEPASDQNGGGATSEPGAEAEVQTRVRSVPRRRVIRPGAAGSSAQAPTAAPTARPSGEVAGGSAGVPPTAQSSPEPAPRGEPTPEEPLDSSESEDEQTPEEPRDSGESEPEPTPEEPRDSGESEPQPTLEEPPDSGESEDGPDVFSTGRLDLRLVPKRGTQVASLPRDPAG